MKKFEYTTQSGVRCEHCGNHCLRNVLTFPDGGRWVTGNRCENGLILDETAAVLEDTKENSKENAVLDVFAMREKMLFKAYDYKEVSKHKDITVCRSGQHFLRHWVIMSSFLIKATGKCMRKGLNM